MGSLLRDQHSKSSITESLAIDLAWDKRSLPSSGPTDPQLRVPDSWWPDI